MSNVERIVLSPGANVTHAYNKVNITLSGIGSNFTVIPETLPDGAPPKGHPDTPASFYAKKADRNPTKGPDQKIHWLVAFHFDKKDKTKTPTFNVELPVIPDRAQTTYYYLEKGKLIYLGQTVQNGETVIVPLTLDDPSIGMT
jgi:hypothetical protein